MDTVVTRDLLDNVVELTFPTATPQDREPVMDGFESIAERANEVAEVTLYEDLLIREIGDDVLELAA